MRRPLCFKLGLLLYMLAVAPIGEAQTSVSVHLFMPGGVLPDHELPFTLIREGGDRESLFTDARGRYQLSGDLRQAGEYVMVIVSDRKTFETTTAQFRVLGNTAYVPVFLRPFRGEPPSPKRIVDITAYDAKAPAEAKAAYDHAMKFVSENNAESAISEFTRALAIYPQYFRALYDLGALYLKLNRLDDAAATFTQAIGLNSRYQLLRLNLGDIYNRQGKYGEAIKLFDSLLKEQPSLSKVRIQYANALIGSRQTDAATEQLRLALADRSLENALRAEAHFGLGVLLNREERYRAALGEFEKALVINPESPNTHLYQGIALLNLKQMTEAESALLKAIELGGKRAARAQLYLGQLYYDQQKFDLAVRAFEQYLKEMPGAPNAAQVKAAIEKMKTTQKR